LISLTYIWNQRNEILYSARGIYFYNFTGKKLKKKREIQFCSICIPCTSFMGANCIISLDATLPVELSSFSPLLGSRNCAAQILTLQHSGWARLRLAQKEERNSKTKKNINQSCHYHLIQSIWVQPITA